MLSFRKILNSRRRTRAFSQSIAGLRRAVTTPRGRCAARCSHVVRSEARVDVEVTRSWRRAGQIDGGTRRGQLNADSRNPAEQKRECDTRKTRVHNAVWKRNRGMPTRECDIENAIREKWFKCRPENADIENADIEKRGHRNATSRMRHRERRHENGLGDEGMSPTSVAIIVRPTRPRPQTSLCPIVDSAAGISEAVIRKIYKNGRRHCELRGRAKRPGANSSTVFSVWRAATDRMIRHLQRHVG